MSKKGLEKLVRVFFAYLCFNEDRGIFLKGRIVYWRSYFTRSSAQNIFFSNCSHCRHLIFGVQPRLVVYTAHIDFTLVQYLHSGYRFDLFAKIISQNRKRFQALDWARYLVLKVNWCQNTLILIFKRNSTHFTGYEWNVHVLYHTLYLLRCIIVTLFANHRGHYWKINTIALRIVSIWLW